MPSWPSRCCGGWSWSSWLWPSWMLLSPRRAGRGRIKLSCCRRFPGLGRRLRRSSWPRPARGFPSAAHLAAWAGLAPALHESAGRQTPAGKRHGNKWLTAMLVEAAGSVGRMRGKNYLAAQHARLTRRRGMGRAQVAVAHSMLVSAYWMLKRDEPYHDLGADWHSRRSNEAHTRRLVAQLEHLGHTVTLHPAA
jgi:hypothetical protein